MSANERSAGVQVVIRRHDGCLFVREEKEACEKKELWVFDGGQKFVDAQGRLVSAGGALEWGEDAFAAAAREMHEELGIQPDSKLNLLITAPVFCRQNDKIIGVSVVLYEPTEEEIEELTQRGQWILADEIGFVDGDFKAGSTGTNARPTFVVAAAIVQNFGTLGWKTNCLIRDYNQRVLSLGGGSANGTFRDELLPESIILGET